MIDKHCFDAHIHVETEQMTPYTALELIREKGLKAALVDHVFSDRNRITPDSIKEDCRKSFPDIGFIHGCEADIYGNGLIALPEKFISSMDFIMLSFTHIGQPEVIDKNDLNNMQKLTARMLYLFEAAVAWPHTDVIAHPFALPLDPVQAGKLVMFMEGKQLRTILKKAAERKILIEINARTLRRMALEPQKVLLREAVQCGCLFSIGSDAHCLEEVGKTAEAGDIVDEFKIPYESIIFPSTRRLL